MNLVEDDPFAAKVSSLTLSLQTEVQKKRKEFNHCKARKDTSIHKTNTPLFKKDKRRKENTNKNKKHSKTDPETEELLAKSQMALLKKTQLYNEMNKIDNLDSVIKNSESCLVDFEQKMIDNKITDKYTKLLPEPSNIISNFGGASSSSLINGFIPEGYSKYLKDDEVKSGGSEYLHYQEAIGNEIRERGVGYFSFSTDENIRRQQMQDLDNLHLETQRNIAKRQKVLAKRKAEKDARMQRVRDKMRKELTALGKDVRFLDEADEIARKEKEIQEITTPDNSVSTETKENETLDKQKVEVFKLIDSIRESTREHPVREWDKDKLVVTPVKHFSKREREKEEERNPDFAPPNFYTKKQRKN